MSKIINESGQVIIDEIGSELKFGYYSIDDVFYIEESNIYKKIQPDGVKTVEFALFKNKDKPTILLVEAKKSAPTLLSNGTKLEKLIQKELENTGNADKLPFLNELYKKVKHDVYFDEVKSKFNDTLALFFAIHINIHNTAKLELPKNFQRLEFSTINFVLVLVVKNHPTDSLAALQSKLEKHLKPLVKIWKSITVAVLNEELAKKRGYVINDQIPIL